MEKKEIKKFEVSWTELTSVFFKAEVYALSEDKAKEMIENNYDEIRRETEEDYQETYDINVYKVEEKP